MSIEDDAQAVELRQWEYNNRSRPMPVRFDPGEPGYGPETCEECGDKLPLKRREYGFTVCVPCREEEEYLEERRRGVLS